MELLSRELGVELYRLEKWRDAALAGMEEGPSRPATAIPSRSSWTMP